MNLLSMKCFALLLLLTFRPKFLPQHPVLGHPKPMFFLNLRDQVWHPYKTTGNKTVVYILISIFLSVISGLRRDVGDICALIGYCATLNGSSVLTFRDNVSFPSSRVKNMGPIGCPKRRYGTTTQRSVISQMIADIIHKFRQQTRRQRIPDRMVAGISVSTLTTAAF
jgi:hypothetical protein